LAGRHSHPALVHALTGDEALVKKRIANLAKALDVVRAEVEEKKRKERSEKPGPPGPLFEK
jgi:hypothetical protein